MTIRRIAGVRQGNAVARLEQREKRQDEPSGRPGRNDHARRIKDEVVDVLIVARDPRAQRRYSQRLGIADRAVGQGGLCRSNRR